MSTVGPSVARREPWGAGELAAVAGGVVAGGIGIGISWFGISGTTDLHQQVAWLDIGIAALLVGSAAGACWLLGGQRAVRTRSRVLQSVLDAHRPAAVEQQSRPATTDGAVLVAVAAGTRFHRSTCPLVAGRAVSTATAARHLEVGRSPCGVCAPPVESTTT